MCFFVSSTITFCDFPDLMCDECCAPHYLNITPERVEYKRDTRRYPGDNYDDNEFIVINCECVERSEEPPDGDRPGYGPIMRYPRKRFTPDEIREVHKHSRGRCGICGESWRISQHGRHGWHVDHVIPNVGGGWETEGMENFQVACAKCNLKKGRGYTRRDVRLGLRELVEACVNNAIMKKTGPRLRQTALKPAR